MSLLEYKRERMMKQQRLVHNKAAADLCQFGFGECNRTKLLSTSKNYRPSSELSFSPTLQVIHEEVPSDEGAPNCFSIVSTILLERILMLLIRFSTVAVIVGFFKEESFPTVA